MQPYPLYSCTREDNRFGPLIAHKLKKQGCSSNFKKLALPKAPSNNLIAKQNSICMDIGPSNVMYPVFPLRGKTQQMALQEFIHSEENVWAKLHVHHKTDSNPARVRHVILEMIQTHQLSIIWRPGGHKQM